MSNQTKFGIFVQKSLQNTLFLVCID